MQRPHCASHRRQAGSGRKTRSSAGQGNGNHHEDDDPHLRLYQGGQCQQGAVQRIDPHCIEFDQRCSGTCAAKFAPADEECRERIACGEAGACST